MINTNKYCRVNKIIQTHQIEATQSEISFIQSCTVKDEKSFKQRVFSFLGEEECLGKVYHSDVPKFTDGNVVAGMWNKCFSLGHERRVVSLEKNAERAGCSNNRYAL